MAITPYFIDTIGLHKPSTTQFPTKSKERIVEITYRCSSVLNICSWFEGVGFYTGAVRAVLSLGHAYVETDPKQKNLCLAQAGRGIVDVTAQYTGNPWILIVPDLIATGMRHPTLASDTYNTIRSIANGQYFQ